MAFLINTQTKHWKPSETLDVVKQIALVENETGNKIIRLTAGQPHFSPSEDMLKALSEGGKFNKYEPVSGIQKLREAIAEKFSAERNAGYSSENVLVSVGGKEALYHVFGALTELGDIYIIPVPFWVSIPTQIESFGGICVFAKTNAELKLTKETLMEAISVARVTAKTNGKGKVVALYMNSPCNPSGAEYTLDELKWIAEILKAEGINVISDEVYSSITYSGKTAPSIASIEDMHDKAIIVSSISKEFCCPSYRVGWAIGPKEVIAGMDKRQSDISSGTSVPAQYSAFVGIQSKNAKLHTENMVKYYKENLDYFSSALLGIVLSDGKRMFAIGKLPEGAFYLFPKVSGIFGYKYQFKGKICEIKSSSDAQLFFMRFGVAGIKGSAFGMDEHIRFSYAIDKKSLEDAVGRLKHAGKELEKCV